MSKINPECIIEKSMNSFGLKQDMKTDPQIMKSIIEEYKLDDFKTDNKRMNKFFKDIVSKPQKLQPMFRNIKKGLVTKHPAVIEFLELALRKKWLKQSEYIIRSVHVTYLLEALTATMCNSHDFFVEVQDHYKTKEQIRGINPIHTFSSFLHALGVTHNFFGTVKALSVDPAMVYFRTQRGLTQSRFKKNEAKQLLKDKKINYIEYKLLCPLHRKGLEHCIELLQINIYEAGITEYKKGLKTNAICAHELSEDVKHNPPSTIFKKKKVVPDNNTDDFYKSISEIENLFPVFGFSQEWVSLYLTWNMNFMLNNLDELDILFPKLIIPSLINCESENFLGVRIISLWLSVNHYFFRKYDNIKSVPAPNMNELGHAWAKINKKYAFDLAERETHEDSKTLKKTYTRFFSHSFRSLFRLVKAFLI